MEFKNTFGTLSFLFDAFNCFCLLSAVSFCSEQCKAVYYVQFRGQHTYSTCTGIVFDLHVTDKYKNHICVGSFSSLTDLHNYVCEHKLPFYFDINLLISICNRANIVK